MPGDGSAFNCVNCRCTANMRARAALDESDLERLKERAKFYGLDKSKDFDDFKAKYLKLSDDAGNINKKDNLIAFSAGKDIKESEDFAENTLHLSNSDYSLMHVDVANMVNNEITKVYNEFGDLHTAGYLEGIRILTEKRNYVAAYSPPMKEVFLLKSKVSSKSSISEMKKQAEKQNKLGFWSTDESEHSIRHELGHAVQYYIINNDQNKFDQITKLRNQVTKDCGITNWSLTDSNEHMTAAGDKLSYYALKDNGEFVAESIAEYMTGRPRELATKVFNILKGVK